MTNDVQPVPNAFLEAVGRVTVQGAQLDARLHTLLGNLALDPVLLRRANGASTGQLINFCDLALKNGTLEQGEIAEVKAALARADALRERRNAVVHSIHLRFESSEVLKQLKAARRTLGYNSTTITVEEMEALAVEMQELGVELFRVGWNAGPAKAPGMDRIPPQLPGGDTPSAQA
ncbi:hypothetical protein SEA_KROMP_69 [Streptomyces phage Kromp]|uniref:Uncharacterized protein n=1 Tax=Streptomyces phage Kromp TaxID=2315619 RepID=A0A386KBR9_9CAUD|nr:hypothetical protein SEA_KROMP_69 [Streptomyces phage Kromp]